MKREPAEPLLARAAVVDPAEPAAAAGRAARGRSAAAAPTGADFGRAWRALAPRPPTEADARLRAIAHAAARRITSPAQAAPRNAAAMAPPAAVTPLLPPLPRFLQVEPVGRCNLACRMCAVPQRPAEQQAGTLSVADFERLLAQLPQLEELHLQGLGEPMLHPAFFTLVERAAQRGVRVSANTNATLITPSRARACVTSGLAVLSFSVDGARAATYESIRVDGNFAKVIRNIERVVRARRELRSATPALRLVMVLMRQNLDELPALVELAARLGVEEVLVQRLASEMSEPSLPLRYIPVRRYVSDSELRGIDLAEAAAVFSAARERAARLGIVLHLPRLGAPMSAVPARDDRSAAAAPAAGCDWPFAKGYVTATGELLPCCMVGTPDRATLGNALHDGMAAVWHGPAAQQWRAGLLGGAPGALCAGCALYRGAF